MPCGKVSPFSSTRWVGGDAGLAPGTSSTTSSLKGSLTSSACCGVQTMKRAPLTSAQTSAFQPRGSVSVCGLLAAGTPNGTDANDSALTLRAAATGRELATTAPTAASASAPNEQIKILRNMGLMLAQDSRRARLPCGAGGPARIVHARDGLASL